MSEEQDRPSGMEGEVYDLVSRKGPITFEGLMNQVGSMSRDEVITHLRSLESDGYVVEKEVEVEKHDVTFTREMWAVTDS